MSLTTPFNGILSFLSDDETTSLAFDPNNVSGHVLTLGANLTTTPIYTYINAQTINYNGVDSANISMLANLPIGLATLINAGAPATSKDFKFGYDASNYCNINFGSSGTMNFQITTASTATFTFNRDMTISGTSSANGTTLSLTNSSSGATQKLVCAGATSSIAPAGSFYILGHGSATPDFCIKAKKVGINSTSSIAYLQVEGTTEQLRLLYDASNYASWTMSSAGNSTITQTGTTLTLFNATATTVNAFGGATTINMGNASGTTNLAGNAIITKTTEQLRLAYDGTNQVHFIVSSNGNLTIAGNNIDDTAIYFTQGVQIGAKFKISSSSTDKFQIIYDGTNYVTQDVNGSAIYDITVSGTNPVIRLNNPTKLSSGYTVSALLALTPSVGWRAYVTDSADSPTWGSTVTTGSGAGNFPVYYDGTNWIYA